MTAVNYETGEVVETIGAAEARRLTTEAQNEFRSSADHFARGWALIEKAVNGGGHADLGYPSPGAYLHAEFDGVLAGLDVAARRVAVRSMTDWGLSTRAIAKPLGVSNKTVSVDQREGVTEVTPEPQSPQGGGAPEPASETPPVEPTSPRPAEPKPITGMDGKTYQRPEPKAAPKAAPRRALTDQFFDAAYDLTKAAERVERLTSDDRFPQNAEKVGTKHRADLLRAVELLSKALDRFPS